MTPKDALTGWLLAVGWAAHAAGFNPTSPYEPGSTAFVSAIRHDLPVANADRAYVTGGFFVGRGQELAGILDEAHTPDASRILVRGAAGTGKSSLVRQVAERYDHYWAACDLYREPSGMLHKIVGQAPRGPALVVLDPIDAGALENPSAFARAVADRPELNLLMTARSEGDIHPSWNDALRDTGAVTRFELGPLMTPEISELLQAEGVDSETADLLAADMDGHPALVQRIAGHLQDDVPLPGAESNLATILGPDGRPLEPSDDGFEAATLTASGISAALIAELAKRPELMYELSPRKFEELVAELYTREGFEVELTPTSKDGGIDIYAVQHAPFGSFLTIVDCKRHRADRPVQVGLIRQLYGTVMSANASVGVMATTSYFTKGAKAFQAERKHRLGLQDFLSIQDMLLSADQSSDGLRRLDIPQE